MLLVATLAAVMALPPIAQDPTYHGFADRRGSPPPIHFFNAFINLAFLAAGIAGIIIVRGWVRRITKVRQPKTGLNVRCYRDFHCPANEKSGRASLRSGQVEPADSLRSN